MSLSFCCDNQIGSERTGNHESVLPFIIGLGWWWCNGVVDIFLGTLVDHTTVHSSHGCFQLDNIMLQSSNLPKLVS